MSLLQNKSFLVVDDAPDVRMLVRKILESNGAQVTEAETIESGLASAQKNIPQLIILDLELPGLNGFDFLRARDEIDALKDIPIIILSGKKDRVSVMQAISLGAKDYILKPFRTTLLLQKVKKTLRLTSFLSRKLGGDEAIGATFSMNAQVLKASEVGCQIEASVKLGAGENITLTGDLIEKLELNGVPMKASPHPAKYAKPGRYINEIAFVGMSEGRAKKIRTLLKGFK
jgi:DNA-binding response OmpR family regulator